MNMHYSFQIAWSGVGPKRRVEARQRRLYGLHRRRLDRHAASWASAMRSLGARWPRCSATCRRSGLFTSPMQLRNSPGARRGHSASGAAPATGARWSPTPRSMWFRSPRPTSSTPRWPIAALEAGKHVWCEKPMAAELAEAETMVGRSAASGKVAMLGYNYIQNPIIRHIRKLLDEGIIGEVNHVRIEMDEDFMADPEALFYRKRGIVRLWRARRFRRASAVADPHLFGGVAQVMCDMAKPYADRPSRRRARARSRPTTSPPPDAARERRLRLIALNRSAWGRKGRIAMQIFGSKGTILYDQERINEFQLYLTDDGRRNRASAPSWRRRSTRPTTASSRRPAMASASTTSRSSSAASWSGCSQASRQWRSRSRKGSRSSALLRPWRGRSRPDAGSRSKARAFSRRSERGPTAPH